MQRERERAEPDMNKIMIKELIILRLVLGLIYFTQKKITELKSTLQTLKVTKKLELKYLENA